MNNNNDEPQKLVVSKNNGLITKIWGEHMWESFHCIAYGYPIEPTEEQKQQYKDFFTAVKNVLPCGYCRTSYSDFIANDPDVKLTDKDLENREALTRWLYRLHNRVNKKLGINYYVTYDDIDKKYESYRAKCMPNEKGCNMPLNLKAESYKMSKIQHAPVLGGNQSMETPEDREKAKEEIKKRYYGFKKYAQMRGLDFFNDAILNLLDMDRYSDAWILRDKKCRQLLNKMRLEALPQIEKDETHQFYQLPSVNELKLISLLCTDICCEELDIMLERINQLVI